MISKSLRRLASVLAAVGCLGLVGAASASAQGPWSLNYRGSRIRIVWMPGYQDPGNPAQGIPPTPAQYNKVGVIKVGSPWARNVLVLEPGTSAAGAYFVPLAEWITSTLPGWQVWSVERRETLLEDQSVFNQGKEGTATPQQVFNYYLGYLANPSITTHVQSIPDSSVEFAKDWGMNTQIEDLHRVIEAAARLGGKVVLGGHSLGGAVVTAYATWDFNGRPGADRLAGLVYDDGGSLGAVSAQAATQELQGLDSSSATPWLAFGGIPAPYAGIYSEAGGESVFAAPNDPSIGQASGLLPSVLVPSEPVTNEAQFGYALNVGTSPASLIAAQAHLGKGISSQTINGYHTWDSTGALTPITRFAAMLSGWPLLNVSGAEWYFPDRFTLDAGDVNNGLPTASQSVLNIHSTLGTELPKRLRIYAFGAALGGAGVPADAQALAQQSGIPMSNLTLVNDQTSSPQGIPYAHNDPAGAYPSNDFFNHLIPFLEKIGRYRRF